MPATYEPIATTTLSSAASSITFSSIPATYTDLRVVFVNTSTSGNQNASLRLNGDTSALYSYTTLRGNGTTASSVSSGANNSRIDLTSDGTSDTIPTFFSIDIFSYAGSTYKTMLTTGQEDKNGSGTVNRIVALYRSTSAITSLTLTCNTSTWVAGTTATIYGILKA